MESKASMWTLPSPARPASWGCHNPAQQTGLRQLESTLSRSGGQAEAGLDGAPAPGLP